LKAGNSANIVICGAGVAGISTAYFLATHYGITDITLVDERDPLSLTSDKSTECYRNWWPGPGDAMVALMNHSIDLMEELAHESGNIFHLNRRGYLYLTADPDRALKLQAEAVDISRLGGGPLRMHTGNPEEADYLSADPYNFTDQPQGADLFLGREQIHQHFPYISQKAIAALHVRRAGWLSAQQLGMYMLERARAQGVRFLHSRLQRVTVQGGKVKAVHLADGQQIDTPCFINAAGPFLGQVGRMMEVEIPVFSELHLKASINDHMGVVPRQAPLLIWTDPQTLPWTDEERSILAEDAETRWMLTEFPAGVHARPEGGKDSPVVLMLWEYHATPLEPTFPPPLDPQYPEIVLRGLSTMLPGLETYLRKTPRPVLDGGYYTKTYENRPLIGPLSVGGAYLIGALSGFGIMACCGAGELLARHIAGDSLPYYAPHFNLNRYQDYEYLHLLKNWGPSGQL